MRGNFYAVVPAGGSGTRLWPLSRAHKPKFLLPLIGPQTMLQATIERLVPLCDPARVLVVTGAAHADEVRRQVPELGAEQILIEPVPRGTGPAIGLATATAYAQDPEAIVGSFAADHVVTQPEVFHATIRAAMETAKQGYLVTIGIQPDYPETGYGYICAGRSLGSVAGIAVSEVKKFQEKPDLETATQYVASGDYLWNASMFVWQARTLLEELRQHLPDLAEALMRIAAAWNTPERQRVLGEIWPSIAEVTIDQGILERSSRVAVVPGTFGWSDLGDWHGLGVISANGSGDNVVLNAEMLARDAQRMMVMGSGRLVALLGVEDLIVVDTADALLVCHRSRAQEVKYLVDDLKRRGSMQLI